MMERCKVVGNLASPRKNSNRGKCKNHEIYNRIELKLLNFNSDEIYNQDLCSNFYFYFCDILWDINPYKKLAYIRSVYFKYTFIKYLIL